MRVVILAMALVAGLAPTSVAAQGFARVSALEPSVQINYWDEARGTGGGAFAFDSLTTKQVEGAITDSLEGARIPVLAFGAPYVKNAAILWVTISVLLPETSKDTYVVAIGIKATQPAVLQTGSSVEFASFWEVPPTLESMSKLNFGKASQHRVAELVAMAIDEYRRDNR